MSKKESVLNLVMVQHTGSLPQAGQSEQRGGEGEELKESLKV